ncbi:MAG: hypothetical protein NZM38_04795 [Cytophagales bacterium]|nr:hypothetical protein [Cytophagales bacterium]MDW8384070.1 hypothetical protein [Flammeovirgaceae bacterium]
METEKSIQKLYEDEEFVEFYDPENYPWIPKGKYKVSNYGRVFSFNQECTYHQSKNGGYFIRIAGNGKNTSMMRAKMVLIAFKGVHPAKTKAHHLDGDVFNDKISNLEWATEKEISQFRMQNPVHYQRVSQMGKANKGRKIVSKRNQKLTEEEVKWIKYAIKKGHSDEYILKNLNYKIKSLNSIKYGYSWKKIE